MLRLRRDPARPPGTLKAWQVFLVVAGALAVAVVLNAPHLLREAEQKPFGGDRDFWVAVWRPFDDASRVLRLDEPRRALDHALNRDDASPPKQFALPPVAVREPARPAAGPPVVPTTSATPLPTASAPVSLSVFVPSPGEPIVPPVSPVPWPPLRTPTAERPLRIWVGGDSLSVRPGESLARMAVDSGLMTAQLDSHIATGLARPDVFDWPAQVAASAATDPGPEVMVVLFGANDLQGMRTPSGETVAPGTDAWREEYARRVAGLLALMRAPRRLVVWIGLPIARDGSLSARLQETNEVIRSQVEGLPGVLYVDAWKLFQDGDGNYSAYLADEAGAMQQVREPDGLHFTRAGGDRIAAAIMAQVREAAGLPAK